MSGKDQVVFRAGILPYYVPDDGGPIEYMFMRPSDPTYGGPEWQLAKGRVENSDSNFITALREGAEELGLKESNIIEIEELGTFLGRTVIYICRVYNKDDFSEFHYETGAVIWLTLEHFINIGRALHHDVVRKTDKIVTSRCLLSDS